MKKTVVFLMLGILLLTLVGCVQGVQSQLPAGNCEILSSQPQQEPENKKEKEYISVSQPKAHYTEEMLLERAELILRGVAVQKAKEWMLNPDGTRVNEQGEPIVNAQITEYSVEIKDVYKGTVDEDHITVKLMNGYGLSSDLILYGEDENYKLISELTVDQLEIGTEALFLLEWSDETNDAEDGYYISVQPLGYLTLNEDGSYSNAAGNTIKIEELK